MKIACFSSILADGNPSSGYEIANEAIAKGLRGIGHEVVEFGFRLPRQNQQSDENTHVFDCFNVENAEASTFQKLSWLLRAQATGLPISAAKLTAYPQAKVLQAVEERGPFDGYLINSYQMAAAYPELMKRPFVYVAHNVEHRSAAQNAVAAESSLQRYFYRRDARLLKVLEAKLCSEARYVWTLSEDDLLAHNVVAERGSVLPLVAPLVPEPQTKPAKEYDIGLIGTWSWQPNLVGLNWFIDHVVPLLPKDCTIAVAGNVPESAAKKDPRVTYLGRVPSASKFLESVRVVPLISRGGTGVQLKTIEALQAGYATVATSSALRGIETVPENCIQADSETAFATGLMNLVSKSRAGKAIDGDGAAFYQSQLAALHASLVKGLNAFS